MLEPGKRRLFLDTLRPPEGYEFDRAVGATFTLDLMALLSVPLAFTFRDAQDGEGELATDPIALLEGARRHASRIAVFCHGGYTSVPPAGQSALAFLEESMIAAFPPASGEDTRIFHPKVWVLRYVSRGDPAKSRYRLICQSRNLTFDKSWDVSLALDGEFNDSRVNAYAVNHPLADFIQALPALARGPIASVHEETIEIFTDELRRVNFVPPAGLKLERFLPFGIGARNPSFPDPKLRRRPMLVISPFLGGEFLRSAVASRHWSALVSRREELLKTPPDVIRQFDQVYAFRTGLEPEPDDSQMDLHPLAGLHAKMFVIDDGWDARVIVGSANSTGAALGDPPRNVEFMVELSGRKSRYGIDALLNTSGDTESGTFRSLIEEFDVSEAGTVEEDERRVRLERALDQAAETLTRAELKGRVSEAEDGLYDMTLEMDAAPSLPRAVRRVTWWPATLPGTLQRPLEDGAGFDGLSLPQLSAFLAIQVEAAIEGDSDRKRFVRKIELSGLPEDRLPRLLAGMLRNRSRLMQLLWLLLLPDDDLSFDEFSQLLTDDKSAAEIRPAFPGLLERMLETLASDPARLDSVDSLLRDLRKTEHGSDLIGEDFEAIWDAVWAVRSEMK